MARKLHWLIAVAPQELRGNMVCTACRREIASGAYRWRETEEAYLSQHRACSTNWPAWSAYDRKVKAVSDHETARRAAFDEFVAKWGVPDDLIEEMREAAYG